MTFRFIFSFEVIRRQPGLVVAISLFGFYANSRAYWHESGSPMQTIHTLGKQFTVTQVNTSAY